MRRDLWGRLERLETNAGALQSALTLPDGAHVLYTVDEALEAVGEGRPYGAGRARYSAPSWRPRRRRGCRGYAAPSWARASGRPAGAPVGSLRGRLRKLEEATAAEMLTIEHEGGGVSRFHEDAVEECFLHEIARGRRHRDGEAPEGEDDAHPLTVALRTAANLEDLMGREGTILGLFVGEDEILRGVRERKGPPVEWNADGTVCS